MHRWGVLRRPLHSNFGMKKQTALVMCLCQLHNYCIDRRLGESIGTSNASGAPSLQVVETEIIIEGGVSLTERRDGCNDCSPEALLHGGHHFKDVGGKNAIANAERAAERCAVRDAVPLPRDLLFDSVIDQGLKRPKPASWLNK